MIDIALAKALNSPAGSLQLDVQAHIDTGSFAALFGPSGAGKTTVLRMLAGLTRPDRGRIIVDGKTWFDSATRINLSPQQRSIGFMFQDYALFPNLSVRQNIAYAVDARDRGWIDELLELSGLGDLQHRKPATLSGGQKQRVALARAISRKPALLLLDEPLSALDASLRQQLQDDLARLHHRFGMTTLLVSHDIGEVFRLSQRVLRMDEGRIVQSGTPAELFLQKGQAGKLNLPAQVLAIRREEVVHIVTLLIGQEIIEVIASDDDVRGLREGDTVSVSTKTFSPALSRKMEGLIDPPR